MATHTPKYYDVNENNGNRLKFFSCYLKCVGSLAIVIVKSLSFRKIIIQAVGKQNNKRIKLHILLKLL